jgi:pimeloyl-ACP methyl ester carboxylesterase
MNYYDQDKKEYHELFPQYTVQMNGKEFIYRYGGNGTQTVVLLVGGLGVADAFCNHARMLGRSFKVLTFDYPVHIHTNDELADAIVSLITHLSIGKVYLVGQSYGGFLAQIIAARHSEIVKGLILSNTGCLSNEITEEAWKPLYDMVNRMKKLNAILKVVPISLFRKSFIKKSLKHLDGWQDPEYSYMKALFKDIYGKLTNKKERHMCSLMIDLLHSPKTVKSDFDYLEGKVLLFLSKDDFTFGEEIKKALIELMPAPILYDDLDGGHVALFLKIDTYCERIREFVIS